VRKKDAARGALLLIGVRSVSGVSVTFYLRLIHSLFALSALSLGSLAMQLGFVCTMRALCATSDLQIPLQKHRITTRECTSFTPAAAAAIFTSKVMRHTGVRIAIN